MAYMSDIDLATLHKTRLEEKVNYKLSWLTNHKTRPTGSLMVIDQAQQPKAYCHQWKTVNRGENGAVVESKSAGTKKICDKRLDDFDDLSDEGYFSSETRRRRSGTWP